ncbi:CstA-like transporter-associated (seleno)protein [Nocardioides pacificus]
MTGFWARARWYLAEISGDARYERYVARCEAAGEAARDRASYERHRSAYRDAHPEGRCC